MADEQRSDPAATSDLNANEWYYRAVWRGILSQVLGWPPERIARWSDRALAGVRDNPMRAGVVFNETPEEAVAYECIPPDLRARLTGLELALLEQEIGAILDDDRVALVPADFHPETFAWTVYRPVLEQLLAKHDASLPVMQP